MQWALWGVRKAGLWFSDGLGRGEQALQAGSFEATQCVTEQAPSLWVDLVLFLEQKGRTVCRMWGAERGEAGHDSWALINLV